MVSLANYLMLSAVLFGISVAGIVINRRNIVIILMCIELLLLAVNTNFVAFASFWDDIQGQIFVLFVLTVAAAEAAIGLAILVVIFRQHHSIAIDELSQLKG